MPLQAFTELVRGQTQDDYRPNKAMTPSVLRRLCAGYEHLDELLDIANHGARVHLTSPLPLHPTFPRNHPSAAQRLPVLRANIRKEQDLFRCLVLDEDIAEIWTELFFSPFGVVDKGAGDPLTSGRVIHDLSFPDNDSVNSHTDQDEVPTAAFDHCSCVAKEILRLRRSKPGREVKLMAGDVASAYRNVCTHSECVYMFAGHIPEDAAIVIDLAAAFGWTGSSGTYGVLGGAVAFAHGSTTNATHPGGFYNYHWVDDHINVTDDTGSNCADIDRSLRWAMTSIMGPAAVNNDKFTPWSTCLKVLGLIFDTTAETVSMPPEKIAKTKRLVSHAFHTRNLARSEYRSLLGSLRHVVTCIRPARVFLQRLRAGERLLHRSRRIPVSDNMRDDLLWWWAILDSPTLNGIPLEYFDAHPNQDITILTDASDEGICAIDPAAS
ncbi:hypothetical protein PR003_g28435, partial [Phytophthora rubi]